MNLLYLTILFPFLGFLLLTFFCNKSSKKFISIIGVGSIFLSFIISFLVTLDFIKNSKKNIYIYNQKLFNWIDINNFNISLNLYLDDLSITILLIVIIIGLLVHIYSINYIKITEDYRRFFSYMNLFISSMILLILSDNFLVMYIGWEGVGICSYLFIGFDYTKYKNIIFSMKSFIITRIGDLCLIFSMIILYNKFNTLNFTTLFLEKNQEIFKNSTSIYIAMFSILIGTIGKSAQIPLNTWLSDAMSAPTPSSALLHSSTMVISGIYLISRINKLFLYFPNLLYIISIIGSITIIMTSIFALSEKNIKKILAYSTMSQLGYIFLSLGIEEWYLAILHLIIHAFIKSLLFLSSDYLINFYNKEQNIYKIGIFKNSNYLLYFLFLFGAFYLSSFPFITPSFYSKDLILLQTLEKNHLFLFIIAIIGSFFTVLYIFRMILIIFYKKEKINPFYIKKKYIFKIFSLFLLIFLSIFIGPWTILPINKFFIKNLFYKKKLFYIELISSILIILGIIISYYIWGSSKKILIFIKKNKLYKFLFYYIFNPKNIDFIYKKIFVYPFLLISKYLKIDPINYFINKNILKIYSIINKSNNILKKNISTSYISIFLGLLIIIFLLI
ncbi:NADH-quinone oxidoreductase subunit L [Sodalis-like secondary symbiont of Drepanosiphum platanoidis]|uniref:NADH-quinone oxidoreductase subunit L n=1 Tax=Sodalis-like secondary symbiont of Drepanosiphum platanoidis TaxID=2994493 RepID=UPI00346483AC